MSNLGKFFKLGGGKAPKPPRRDYDGSRSSSEYSEDEDSYLDPTMVHPTSSPTDGSTAPVQMPTYPPPRPNHLPAARRIQDSTKRASVPVTFGQTPKGPQTKSRPQRPQSAEHLQPVRNPVPVQRSGIVAPNYKMPRDDYSDPWDAKKAQSPGRDYSDPWDAKTKRGDDYLEPWDATKQQTRDDYCDPWDQTTSTGDPGTAMKVPKDDYIDPWDATDSNQSQVESAQKPEENIKHSGPESDDESYSEPYDTGKITELDEKAKRFSLKGMHPSSMDEMSSFVQEEKPRETSEAVFEGGIRKPQSPSKDMRPVDDYDSPWESKSFLMTRQKSPGLSKEKTQAPVMDTRPADDYDKPWEWTKKTTFDGLTPTPKAQEPSQTPAADSRAAEDYDKPWEWSKSKQFVSLVQGKDEQAQTSNTVAPPKPPRMFANNESLIDPSLPLEQQGWYHGPIKRAEAEKLLQSADDCSFLVRNSESSKKDFSLSVRNNNTYMHLKIVCGEKGYILGQFSKPFDTVPEVIHHYSINKLNIRGAEHKRLLHPVLEPPEYYTLEPGD